jgi:histidinol phosphatase-like PHP family hydrolase
MKPTLSRRDVLVLGTAGAFSSLAKESVSPDEIPTRDGVPRVDYHAHPETGMTVDRAVALSKERGVKFGLLQHAGVRESGYADLVSNDDELEAWIHSLEGKPVFKGVQAELLNWPSVFSKETVAKLDYVLSDALTMPGKSGGWIKIWTPAFRCDDVQDFMDRYVDFHEEVMAKEPIDIMANPTFLPEALEADYDKLWTEKRMRKIIESAVRHHVALEINSRYKVPRLPFLEMAKAARAKFSFGSNAHTADAIGDIDYGVAMYRKLGLTLKEFFYPAPPGKKPIQIRTLA